jgi:fibronectin-binding autotransporter adhesin
MARVNIARIVVLVALITDIVPVFAGSATWNLNPGSSDWNTNANWTPATGFPDGSSDTATFALSATPKVSISANTEVNGIVFNSGASAFTITASPSVTLTISGTGITNNSGVTQHFASAVDGSGNRGVINFTNSATAGAQTAFTNNGATVNGANGGSTQFNNSSTAGNGTFTTNGGTAGGVTRFGDSSTAGNGAFTTNGGTVSGALGGVTLFYISSTAGNGTFITNGGTVSGGDRGATRFFDSSTAGNGAFTTNGATVSNTLGGLTTFSDSSTAGNGAFTTNGATVSGAGGGVMEFYDSSSAGAATLIANGGMNGGQGGRISFYTLSTGGTARVEVFGNGDLDIGFHYSSGVTIGSIEGSGNVFLGANNLTLGSNALSTTFSGVIQDGGLGPGGSLTKIGIGTLTLNGTNTYTGATTVSAGTLLVNGSLTSNVTVNGGTFGGAGTVPNIVVNSGATLGPGSSPGILFVTGNLTLNLGATYLVDLNGTAVGTQYDQTEVVGTVNLNNGTLSLSLGFTPALGTQFMIISNALSDAVVGTFNGLSEGATFTSGGTIFKISYQGGNGNDVVLSVVPEPGTWALLSLAGAVVVVFRRRS